MLMREGPRVGDRRTVHPFPMDQPTTPHALPRARTSNGKISAGYSHGTVSHVAPKMAVKRKTKNIAPPPTPEVLPPLALALIVARARPPAQNMQMP